MGLQKYIQKRDFKKTTEPPGKIKQSSAGNRFFIQKHAASHLHFDFRLEYNGVLKSWAVPKGPSVSAKVKRLAMEVEDHPLDYGDFEGTIPKGEYGGGTVMLWDEGTWTPENDPKLGFKKGHLAFSLKGKRLKGRWDLVRTHQPDGKKNMWFLIHKKESGASGPEPVETKMTSVTTHRTMEQIAKGNKVWHSDKKKERIAVAKLFQLPENFKPQLATLVDDAPSGDQWIHEVKFDGYRIFAYIKNGDVRLFTRNKNDWTDKLQSVAKAIKFLGVKNALIDGEVIVPGPAGQSDFQALQNAFKENKQESFVYYIFDLLSLEKKDLTKLSLEKRKKKLKEILNNGENSTLKYSEHIQGSGNKIFEDACRLDLEGIISKKLNSEYGGGRGGDWLKVKCIKRQEFVVIGYTAPKGSRIGIGALLLAFHDQVNRLRYVGKVGTGFDDALLRDLKKRFDKLKVKSVDAYDSSGELALQRQVTWVKPKIVAEVKFGSWTKDLHLRHSVFVGLRLDKPAREVVREEPQKLIPKKKENPKEQSALKKIKTTKLEKVLFSPDISKGDLFNYYINVQKWIMPYLIDRPLALVRCPDGHDKFCFFQKHISSGKVGDNERKFLKENKKAEFIYVNSLEGLLSLVQMGVLELHGWQSSVSKVEKPDQIVFDFDPHENVKWSSVIEGALRLRDRLKRMKLESFVKTTGGKGVHVVVPIIPDKGWDEVKNFSKTIAETFVAEFPSLYLANMSKAKRPGKIFIDYLRNGRGSTAVLPYSTRARAHAPVSVPVSWEELPRTKSGDEFTLKNLEERLKTLKVDPWKKFFITKQKLPDLNSLA